ncbi:hypothetical protein [Acidomonas methanolica]|uniref:ABC transporter n=2 Tax=Acidomonas methanolica TaxID=437 RepID=A0A023D4S5_ACIMT|nr:hypothetical protein [Acidomonas methanolica]MBU2653599.1 hypothetical protein [Acidomonas methanolica]TCS31550.1 ABC-2 type transport system permease protein [Acidomonas methanolica]GAJ28765.1 ABC transporter [Acidomonas methanolica NBRC 104435]GEK97969.1 ABC transporter permease [Acidomonas methanolica NBRC 104435]
MSATVTRASRSRGQVLFWSMRRELWENRFLLVVPALAAALLPLAFLVIAVMVLRGRADVTGGFHVDSGTLLTSCTRPAIAAAILAGIVYGLGALHNEARDRSLLFWKSMPVSDAMAVAAKMLVIILVLPLFAMICAAVACLLLIMFSMLLGGRPGLALAHLPGEAVFQTGATLLLFLWMFPLWGWLLLVSAAARRSPFLWAFGLPLAVIVLEYMTFGTGHAARLVLGHFRPILPFMAGNLEIVTHGTSVGLSGMPLRVNAAALASGAYGISAPGLWIGLGAGLLMTGGAVEIRRRQTLL